MNTHKVRIAYSDSGGVWTAQLGRVTLAVDRDAHLLSYTAHPADPGYRATKRALLRALRRAIRQSNAQLSYHLSFKKEVHHGSKH